MFSAVSPSGLFQLSWTPDTRFFLERWNGERSVLEVDGLAAAEPGAAITAATVTDNGWFCLAVSLEPANPAGRSAYFVAGPDGHRYSGGQLLHPVVSVGLSPSGTWLALAMPDLLHPEGYLPDATRLQLRNVAMGVVVWDVWPWTGPGHIACRFDELGGQLFLEYEDERLYAYRLSDGRCTEREAYRKDLLEDGTALQLAELARREFLDLGPPEALTPGERRMAARSIFELLTMASQIDTECPATFHALGQFFDWLPDAAKAQRCYGRMQELAPQYCGPSWKH